MPEESKLAGILTKKVGDLPIWTWGLIGAAGVGVGYLIIHKTHAIPSSPTSSDTVLTSPVGDTGSQPGTGLSTPSAPGSSGLPSNVNQYGAQTTPPGPGYVPIYDSNGNLVGWQFGNTSMQGGVPPNPPGGGGPYPPVPPVPPGSQQPGTYFKGPTGVGHYVATGTETLEQIGIKLHDNRNPSDPLSIETLNKQPANYVPPLGMILTV